MATLTSRQLIVATLAEAAAFHSVRLLPWAGPAKFGAKPGAQTRSALAVHIGLSHLPPFRTPPGTAETAESQFRSVRGQSRSDDRTPLPANMESFTAIH